MRRSDMKRALILILLAMSVLTFVGCTVYSSSYSAIGFVHSNVSDSAYMSFSSFRGRMVFHLKFKEPGQLACSAKLGSGEATVYYDKDGTKRELFKVQGGDDFVLSPVNFEAGKVHLIVETNGKCTDGDLKFKVQ